MSTKLLRLPMVLEFDEQSLGFYTMNAPVATSLDFSSSSNSASLLSMDQQRAFSSPSDDSEYTNSALEYISQVLMEDDVEEKPCMFHDELALQATEKSLYDVLGEKFPYVEQTQISLYASQSAESSDYSVAFSGQNSPASSSYISSSIDPLWNGVNSPSCLETLTPALANVVAQTAFNSSNDGDEVLGSSVSELVTPNFFLQSEWALQFNKGVEEASKFLPKLSHLTTAPENHASMYELREMISKTDVSTGLDEREFAPPSFLKGKKNYERGEDEELEKGRNNKQSAVSIDENELSELFDKVLVFSAIEPPIPTCNLDQSLQERASTSLEQKEQTNGSRGGKTRTRKKRDKTEVIDLRTRLILCAQALSSNDLRSANEQLKQIRQHSSCFGDGNQRLAHVFADALEARIAGTGNEIYTSLCSKRKPAADVLKAYELYHSACPFQRSAIYFGNRSILEFVKEKKATTLHIVDFGILHGFQWPPLISRLLQLIQGPLKLRITGIDLPTYGFRPAAAVQETGRRLAKYCERFNVPFEYNGIAQKWETIQVEDLKLRSNEVVAVNCLYRLQNLFDDTILVNNPRDSVLNLIREINPDMFVHSIVNGSYRTPFFLTRFKDVLFHYSALFDIFDSNISREDEIRLFFEQEIFGREVMNVVACEGTERIERPESYKQWQVRTMRAGFRQRALDSDVLNKLRGWVKNDFKDHGDFIVGTDGEWMLQGWKGKILFASSIWLPA